MIQSKPFFGDCSGKYDYIFDVTIQMHDFKSDFLPSDSHFGHKLTFCVMILQQYSSNLTRYHNISQSEK